MPSCHQKIFEEKKRTSLPKPTNASTRQHSSDWHLWWRGRGVVPCPMSSSSVPNSNCWEPTSQENGGDTSVRTECGAVTPCRWTLDALSWCPSDEGIGVRKSPARTKPTFIEVSSQNRQSGSLERHHDNPPSTQLRFSDGSISEPFDVVVGADGIKSVVRSAFTENLSNQLISALPLSAGSLIRSYIFSFKDEDPKG